METEEQKQVDEEYSKLNSLLHLNMSNVKAKMEIVKIVSEIVSLEIELSKEEGA